MPRKKRDSHGRMHKRSGPKPAQQATRRVAQTQLSIHRHNGFGSAARAKIDRQEMPAEGRTERPLYDLAMLVAELAVVITDRGHLSMPLI